MPKTWVHVRYFAVVRDRTGKSEEDLELPVGARAADAMTALIERYPTLAPLRQRLRLAVNEELVSEDAPLRDGDELALIPPVAGGAGRVRLSEEALSTDEAIRSVGHAGAGGVCVFLGIVRNENEGRVVTHLEYEAYGSMAIREMEAIAAALEAATPGVRVAIQHRIGRLSIGEPAVVIAASAPHRAEAFAACRAAIDRLKERVPIWKREHGPAGISWVGSE
jgi:MoaE-MoaD fusion protein